MPGISIATALKPYAAPTPIDMSVNMFKWRVRLDHQPRCNNGQPAQDLSVKTKSGCCVVTR
jgi:hypothetical protein